jgi:large subunit ribosomal protein L21
MTHAVIKTGGKQYLVHEGDVIKIEKLLEEAGQEIAFGEVLLVASDKDIQVGTPLLAGVKVKGEIVKHARLAKVTGVKMKAKKRQRKLFGHKQHYTAVKITGIK